jgi:predicted XRE-type DNA-binding protein
MAGKQKFKSGSFEAIHTSAAALGKVGAIDKKTMRHFDKSCREQRFASVWDALEKTPGEAARMKMRSNLLVAIEQQVRGWGVADAVAAGRLGVTPSRLNELLRGKITNSASTPWLP